MELGRLAHPIGLAEVAPVFTQGFTTIHWGLEPFPANLVAINISKTEFFERSRSANYSAFSLPYSCNQEPADFYSTTNWTLYGSGIAPEVYSNPILEPVNRNITSGTPLCKSGDKCQDNGCIILVDGIGRKMLGKASIVQIAHGLTAIIVLLASLIAGSFLIGEAYPDGAVNDDDLTNFYRSPFSRFNCFNKEHIEPDWVPGPDVVIDPDVPLQEYPTSESFAVQMNRVRNMLTELARLDTAIQGMAHARAGQEDIRENAKQQANSLLIEIQRLVRPWPRMMEQMRVDWTEEQRAQAQKTVEDVFSMVSPRY